jgi:hypothetical protein
VSACITGRPCTLGCSLFCALEPELLEQPPTMNVWARRTVVVGVAVAGALLAAAGPAGADPADDCQLWHGSEHCREVLTGGPYPADTTVAPKPAPECPESRQPCGFIDEQGKRWT